MTSSAQAKDCPKIMSGFKAIFFGQSHSDTYTYITKQLGDGVLCFFLPESRSVRLEFASAPENLKSVFVYGKFRLEFVA
jgi:hypothetical protein